MKTTFFHDVFLAVAAAALVFSPPALAADYPDPDRPIRLVVAYGPGGATDFQARIATLAAGKKDFLGVPIVIFNRPGAGGKVGWTQFVTKAKPNGYQLAAYNVPHFIAQSIVFKTPYAIDNLEPIANWGADPAVLVVAKDSEFNSVGDLLEYAKKNPKKSPSTALESLSVTTLRFCSFSAPPARNSHMCRPRAAALRP